MSLDWYVSNVADAQSVCVVALPEASARSSFDNGWSWERTDVDYRASKLGVTVEVADALGASVRWSPVTLALVGASFICGLQRITQDSINEWWARISMITKLADGAFSLPFGGSEPTPLIRQDVANHVGLSTNVTAITTAAFLRDVAWPAHHRALGIPEPTRARPRRR